MWCAEHYIRVANWTWRDVTVAPVYCTSNSWSPTMYSNYWWFQIQLIHFQLGMFCITGGSRVWRNDMVMQMENVYSELFHIVHASLDRRRHLLFIQYVVLHRTVQRCSVSNNKEPCWAQNRLVLREKKISICSLLLLFP